MRTCLLSEALQPAVGVSITQTLAETVGKLVLLGELERCNRRRLATKVIPVAIFIQREYWNSIDGPARLGKAESATKFSVNVDQR